jgi:hypothetical protein
MSRDDRLAKGSQKRLFPPQAASSTPFQATGCPMRTSTLVLALAFATGLAVAASVVQAQEIRTPARQTMVGTWSTIAGQCTRPLSIITIGPQSLSGEDFSCAFASVQRKGDVVTWKGQCTFGGDDPKPETVTARLAGKQLYYGVRSYGGENGPFVRCP